jgi:hypothetical protein
VTRTELRDASCTPGSAPAPQVQVSRGDHHVKAVVAAVTEGQVQLLPGPRRTAPQLHVTIAHDGKGHRASGLNVLIAGKERFGFAGLAIAPSTGGPKKTSRPLARTQYAAAAARWSPPTSWRRPDDDETAPRMRGAVPLPHAGLVNTGNGSVESCANDNSQVGCAD